jgi:transcriptional regulator with XRE-family HTH domain
VTFKEDFPKRLLAFRTDAKLSQVQLGEAVAVTNKVVSHWENGVSEPSLAALARLAPALGRSADELLGLSPLAERKLPQWIMNDLIMLQQMDPADGGAVSEVIKAFVMKRMHLDEIKRQEIRAKGKK